MTEFERLCDELNVPITMDSCGFYTGMCRALAYICCDVIMEGTSAPTVEAEVKARFYATFPYMKK